MKLKGDDGTVCFDSDWHEWKNAPGGCYAEMPSCNIEIIKNGKREKQPAEFDSLGEVVQCQAYQWLAYSVQIFEEPFYGEKRKLFRKSELGYGNGNYMSLMDAKDDAIYWYLYGVTSVEIERPSDSE